MRLFGLVKHREIKLQAFKGASAKGLTRQGNENRDEIEHVLTENPQAELALFVFGNVDVHLSWFWCKYYKGSVIDLDTIAAEYVEYVAALPGWQRQRRMIVGVYPSQVDAAWVTLSLAVYGVLSQEVGATIEAADCDLAARQERVIGFNRLLKENCEALGVEYMDCFDEMTSGPEHEHRVRAAFLDVSEPNIHPVWETTVLLWIDKLPWLKQRVPPNFEEATRESLATYLKTKPWARRAHPSMPGDGSPEEEQARLRAAEEAAFTPPDLEMSQQRMEEYQLD